MHSLILASEEVVNTSATTPPGDDLMNLALIMLGTVMLIAAIATWMVTPKGHH